MGSHLASCFNFCSDVPTNPVSCGCNGMTDVRARCVPKALTMGAPWANDDEFARCPMNSMTALFYADNNPSIYEVRTFTHTHTHVFTCTHTHTGGLWRKPYALRSVRQGQPHGRGGFRR